MDRAGTLVVESNYYEIKGGKTTIAGECLITHEPIKFEVETSQFEEWITGKKLIQDAFPDLESWKREFMISGIGKNGWNIWFSEK